ncbi:hypothetical protein F442_10521 [Phytophthora nicotianae P10297]|uniref:Uncharacterized protein n=1 Tax=Phytophthora nicotianae P10297 TaxID=1317064 RepID=W2Z678_PHYNI|nr:hypothetical protein F442_10521 [Phytophthora nicotianae P10297]
MASLVTTDTCIFGRVVIGNGREASTGCNAVRITITTANIATNIASIVTATITAVAFIVSVASDAATTFTAVVSGASPAAPTAFALLVGPPPPALTTAPSSPLIDTSVASDVSGESILNHLKELHCGTLFSSSDEESEEEDSEDPRAARPPSPTPSASGLFDDNSDEETEPVGHPANGRINHYGPAALWDYSVPAKIEQLHDVRGESPLRWLIVEWQSTPLQLRWIWEEHLDKRFARRMDQVIQWRDDLCPGVGLEFMLLF